MELKSNEIAHRAEGLKHALRQQRISTKTFLDMTAEMEQGFSNYLRRTYMLDVVGDEVARRTFDIALGIEKGVAEELGEAMNYFAVESIYSKIAEVVNLSS